MMRWAALPRAINAGKPLAMADLRAFLTAEGMADVKTLLASGNAIFSCDATDAREIEARLHTGAREKLALDTLWYVRSHADLVAIAAADPFPEATTARPKHVQVLFHREPVDPTRVATLAASYSGPERLHAIGRELYVDYPDGIGESKLPAAMARAKLPPSTGRNWNTLLKLVEATG
jgi:uncharacterized protein (DUF1697 family)